MDANTPRPLLTAPQLYAWLGVSDFWLRKRLEWDTDFPYSDLAKPGSKQRTLRFEVEAVAAHLGIPVPPREATESTDTAAAA